MKTCTKCGVAKALECFSRQAKGKFGVTSRCKPCCSERGKLWAKSNPERHSANRRAWIARNAERAQAIRNEWLKRNADKERLRLQKWTQDNKARCAEKVAARRAAQMQATPAWADRAAIALVYRYARQCAEATGIEVHVDHIVPLVSDVVCGLHCAENLRVMTGRANRSKSNKWDVNITFYP